MKRLHTGRWKVTNTAMLNTARGNMSEPMIFHIIGMESVWAVLKRSLYGVWHHTSRKHLHRYVNEATFRLNEADCEVHTNDRLISFLYKSFSTRITYQEVIQ